MEQQLQIHMSLNLKKKKVYHIVISFSSYILLINYIEPSQIDIFISAKIPNREKDPLAYDVVAEFMMHGPCGYAETNAPCMKNSSCSKKFPKQIRNETTIEEIEFVNYKHRNTISNVQS